jgi:hypothetical protein
MRSPIFIIQQGSQTHAILRCHAVSAELTHKEMERRRFNNAPRQKLRDEGTLSLQQTFSKSKDRSTIDLG